MDDLNWQNQYKKWQSNLMWETWHLVNFCSIAAVLLLWVCNSTISSWINSLSLSHTLITICLVMSFSLSTSDIPSYAHSVDIINSDWKVKMMKPHLTSLNVGHPMFIFKCGAASNLEPALRILCSDWSRHHMIFISMPLLKLKSTFTRSDF